MSLRPVAAAGADARLAGRGRATVTGLGLSGSPLRCRASEKRYLRGFLAGLARPDAAGVPRAAGAAPFERRHALWVDGMLAGMFSRTGRSAPAAAPARADAAVCWCCGPRRPGNAEEFAARPCADRLRAGLAADRSAWTTPTVADLVGRARRADRHQHVRRRRAAGQRRRLLEPRSPPRRRPRLGRRAVRGARPSATPSLRRLLRPRPPARRAARRAGRARADRPRRLRAGLRRRRTARWRGPGRRPDRRARRRPHRRRSVGATRHARRSPGRNRCGAVVRATSCSTPRARPRRCASSPSTSPSTSVSYEAGDALGRRPRATAPHAVDEWLAATGLTGHEPVDRRRRRRAPAARRAARRLRDLPASRPTCCGFVAERNADRRLAKLLRPAKQGRARAVARGAGRRSTCVAEFAVAGRPPSGLAVLWTPAAAAVLDLVQPAGHPDEVQLTVSVVRYEAPSGARPGRGLLDLPGRPAAVARRRCTCSRATLPAARATPRPDDHGRPGHRHRAVPRLPRGAPRARATGPELAVLRRAAPSRDFYYRDELRGLSDDGLLNRLDLAFSRDQRQQVYVQDRMREHGADVWALARRTARTSTSAATRPGWPRTSTHALPDDRPHPRRAGEDAADEYKRARAAKRYVRDVY